MAALAAAPSAGNAQLILAAVLGIAAVIVLIVWGKWHPFLALVVGSALGKRAGFDRAQTSAVIGGSLPPIAGFLLIVAAGGGFKQVLGQTIKTWSVMETIISVVGFACVLLLNLIISGSRCHARRSTGAAGPDRGRPRSCRR